MTNFLAPEQCSGTGRAIGDLFEAANQRSGHGEGVHAVLKSDYADGVMPSGKFGANAIGGICRSSPPI